MRSLFRHIRHSLSMKLSFGILLLTVLVFVVSLGILFVESRHHIKQEAVELATSILNTSEQRMRRYLNTVETATDATEWLVLENMHPDSLLAFSKPRSYVEWQCQWMLYYHGTLSVPQVW